MQTKYSYMTDSELLFKAETVARHSPLIAELTARLADTLQKLPTVTTVTSIIPVTCPYCESDITAHVVQHIDIQEE